MTDKEFEDWFADNIDTMVAMNIYHHNSEKAKTIRIIMEITYPSLNSLENKMVLIEERLRKIEDTIKNSNDLV